MYNNCKLIRVKYYIIKILYNSFTLQNADTKMQIQNCKIKKQNYIK